jgi:archaellum component FlaC|tara:strand:- start:137 stop:619 length:483 start_codon:yes stop_codon:yes gene_type:complete
MPSIEYQGLKFTGGKFFIIISLIGAIIGGGWTGYKFYDDYLDMKQQVQEFVAPDLSGFDKRIELIQQEVSMLNEEMQMILSEVELVASTAKELKDDLKSDVRQLEADSRHIEALVDGIKNKTREELRLFEDMIRELEDNLQLEIDKALNNPLGNMSAKVK